MLINIPISNEAIVQVQYIKNFALDKLYLEVYKNFPKEIFDFQNLRWEPVDCNHGVILSGEVVFPNQHEWSF
jgi:phosphoribosyl 1,2-cyclic phosphodiesterase